MKNSLITIAVVVFTVISLPVFARLGGAVDPFINNPVVKARLEQIGRAHV